MQKFIKVSIQWIKQIIDRCTGSENKYGIVIDTYDKDAMKSGKISAGEKE